MFDNLCDTGTGSEGKEDERRGRNQLDGGAFYRGGAPRNHPVSLGKRSHSESVGENDTTSVLAFRVVGWALEATSPLLSCSLPPC